MDESYSNAYFESSQRRMGAFSAEGSKPVINHFPFLGPGLVTVFLPLAFNPTTGLGTILVFLEGWRLVFSDCFLLEDGLAEPGPLEVWLPCCFCKAAYYLMKALLFAASISNQRRRTNV